MKKATKMLLSGVITLTVGSGVFIGNGLLASNVMAKDYDSNKLVITTDSSIAVPAKEEPPVKIIKRLKNGAVIANGQEGTGSDQREGIWDEGTPGVNEITREQSLSTAKEKVIEKYALRPEILNKFTIESTYHEAGTYIANSKGNQSVWAIELQPINQSDFAEIGTYAVYINATTGEIIKIFSAADAVG